MSEDRKFSLFFSDYVTVSRFGDDGFDKFFPGKMQFFVMPEKNFKCWVVCRGNGERLIFNAIIPKNVAIVRYEDKPLEVVFGKVPSTTYCNDDGKLIPTVWKFSFLTLTTKRNFYFF